MKIQAQIVLAICQKSANKLYICVLMTFCYLKTLKPQKHTNTHTHTYKRKEKKRKRERGMQTAGDIVIFAIRTH